MSVWFKCDACGHYESRAPGLGGLGSVSGACPLCGGASRYAPEGPPAAHPSRQGSETPNPPEAAPTVLLSHRDAVPALAKLAEAEDPSANAPTVLVTRPSLDAARTEPRRATPTQTIERAGHASTLAMSPQAGLRAEALRRGQLAATAEFGVDEVSGPPSFESAQHPSLQGATPVPPPSNNTSFHNVSPAAQAVGQTLEAPRPALHQAQATHAAPVSAPATLADPSKTAPQAEPQRTPPAEAQRFPQPDASPRPLGGPVVSRAITAPTPVASSDPPTPTVAPKGKKRGVFERPSTAMFDSFDAKAPEPVEAQTPAPSRSWISRYWWILVVVAIVAAVVVAVLASY